MSRGMPEGAQINRWTPEDIEILRKHFCRAGAAGCERYLPGRTMKQIGARANKLGLRYRPLKREQKSSRVVQANLEKTGGPARYSQSFLAGTWKPQPALPIRPGADDWREIQSLR